MFLVQAITTTHCTLKNGTNRMMRIKPKDLLEEDLQSL